MALAFFTLEVIITTERALANLTGCFTRRHGFKEKQIGYPGTLTEKQWDNILDRMIYSFESVIDDDFLSSTTSYDFLVDVQKDLKKIPAKFNPELGMSKKYFRIAQIWKHCLDFIATHNNIQMDYKIGWVLSDEAAAQYSTVDKVEAMLFEIGELDLEG